MAEVGAAWQNGYAERIIRTINEEEVDLSEYENYADAVRQVGLFLDEVYMHKRIHSSLGISPQQSLKANGGSSSQINQMFTSKDTFCVQSDGGSTKDNPL